MKTTVYIVLLTCWLTGLQTFGQSDSLKRIMLSHLTNTGKTPVYSIQTYISVKDNYICEAVGVSDGKDTKADKDNQFKIASITKTMTATIILQMQEEGLLNINEHISKYLNDISYLKINDLHIINGISYGNQITIKQLLQHRSGLADLFTDAPFRFYLSEYLNKKQQWNSEKLIKRYYKYKLNKKACFVPGEGFHYSDVNYFLLGIIIEKVSAKPLAQNLRERIFEPLGMNNSYLEYYETPRGNRKIAHSYMGKRDITNSLNTSYDWAGGGIISTTKDLSKFLNGLFFGRLLKNNSTIVEMTTMLPHTLKSGKISYYGLGLSQYNFNGDIYFGHAGFWGSLMVCCPAKHILFSGSINQVNAPFIPQEFVGQLIKTFTFTNQ